MDSILIAFSVIIALVIGYGLFQTQQKDRKDTQAERSRRTEELRKEYDTAIRSGDKADALQKGRTYYSYLRGGVLSVYDEQALANDLSAMN